jgi:hypothetical protein
MVKQSDLSKIIFSIYVILSFVLKDNAESEATIETHLHLLPYPEYVSQCKLRESLE